jgi:hypothetical protein
MQLSKMNSSDDFIAVCKSDWNQYLTMPNGSSITVADVQKTICSLNITLLEQQMSMDFGALIQLVSNNHNFIHSIF